MPRILSSGHSEASVKVEAENRTFQLNIKSKSGSETFAAPFNIFLTLFESSWDLGSGGDGSVAGKVRGEITSHVMYNKKGKSLTKVTMRGYAVTEGKSYCSVSMFKVWSHIWVRPKPHMEIPISDESDTTEFTDENAGIKVTVTTYSKARIYGKASAQHSKAFTGAGAVAYEKDVVTLPDKTEDEQGLHWSVKHLLERRLMSWSKPASNILDI